MNPFANPAMFEQMKRNMTPEMMQNATNQMNNMSDDDLKRMGQQSGMNFSPEMMRMASSMFSKMDDSQKQNMMNMAQNMNPNQFQQAQQQYGNNNSSQSQTKPQENKSKAQPTSQKKESSAPAPPVDNSLYPSINSLKNKGNDKFKAQDWDGAASFYLEAIISIEEEKMKTINSMQEKELREVEINCRNNYCSVKAKQKDYHSLLIQAQSVMKLDPNNVKAKFRLGQGYFGLNKFEKALPLLTEAKNASPSDQIKFIIQKYLFSKTVAEIYNSCKDEVSKIHKETEKKEQEKAQKEEEKLKNSQQQEKKTQVETEIEEKPKRSSKVQKEQEEVKSNKNEDVVIEEVKEQPKQVQTPAAPAQTQKTASTTNQPRYDTETIKKQQEMMKNMDDNQLDSMAQMVKNMDNETLRQLYKSQGMDLTDEQINMMKNMTTTETLKQTRNLDPATISQRNTQAFQHAQNNSNQNTVQPAAPTIPADKNEAIKMSQEKLKNMDDEQIDNMANMMKGMDNSFLKQLYKSQGMDLSDEQINMMKNMMTPDMIKTASKMNPDQIQKQAGNSPFLNQTQPSSTGESNSTSAPQATAQTMPDMSNMEGMLENTQMLETAFNMIVANPEMLKMMAGQLGPNHPFANYLNNASPEDLKKLVNKLKYLVPVFKYGYKGYKVVKRFKSTILIIIIALIIKYFFL